MPATKLFPAIPIEKVLACLEMYEANIRIVTIAKTLGIGEATVSKIAKRHGLARRHAKSQPRGPRVYCEACGRYRLVGGKGPA